MTRHETEVLEARVVDGDGEAFAELFARNRRGIRRMVDRRLDPRLRGRMSASDVVQEAWLDAEKRLGHFRGRRGLPFRAWLRWITGQRLVDVHREHLATKMRDAGREVGLERGPAGPEGESTAGREVPALDPSPSRVAVRAERADGLRAAMTRLSPLDREVLELRHFEGLGNDEVAERLGLHKAAASKRYVRALGRLKEGLSGADPGDSVA